MSLSSRVVRGPGETARRARESFSGPWHSAHVFLHVTAPSPPPCQGTISCLHPRPQATRTDRLVEDSCPVPVPMEEPLYFKETNRVPRKQTHSPEMLASAKSAHAHFDSVGSLKFHFTTSWQISGQWMVIPLVLAQLPNRPDGCYLCSRLLLPNTVARPACL